jgi:hypothetical protein
MTNSDDGRGVCRNSQFVSRLDLCSAATTQTTLSQRINPMAVNDTEESPLLVSASFQTEIRQQIQQQNQQNNGLIKMNNGLIKMLISLAVCAFFLVLIVVFILVFGSEPFHKAGLKYIGQYWAWLVGTLGLTYVASYLREWRQQAEADTKQLRADTKEWRQQAEADTKELRTEFKADQKELKAEFRTLLDRLDKLDTSIGARINGQDQRIDLIFSTLTGKATLTQV